MLPQQIRSLALIQSLNAKLNNKELIILDNLSIEQAKTSQIRQLLARLKAEEKPLLVIEKRDEKISLASRNISGLCLKAFNYLNAYDVLKHNKVVFTKQALENLIKLRKQ